MTTWKQKEENNNCYY